MASGPYWNPEKGTYSIQYWDVKWHRKIVYRMLHPWKKGDPKPRKNPIDVDREMIRLRQLEETSRARNGRGMPPDLEAFLKAHLATYKNANTRSGVQAAVDQFLDWCKAKKVKSFSDVTVEVCSDWMADRLETMKFSSVKTNRNRLAAAWTDVCAAKGMPNPWRVARLRGKLERKKRGSWSKDQFAKLLDAARPWLGAVLIFGVNTGLRISALIMLDWSDIELSPMDDTSRCFGFVAVRPELDKAGKGYKVPISSELHDLIVTLALNRKHDRVLSGQKGKPVSTRGTVADAIISACERAKLKRPDSPNHHMRRTFGRWAILGTLTGKPVPLYVVSRWLGHSNTDMTLRYLDIEEEDSTRFMLGDS